MKISTGFSFSKVLFDTNNKNHLVVTLDAPPLKKTERRLPICIIPVIDISGSMAGDKLDYAKKSVLKLIDHLQPGDFCGVLTFGSNVTVVSAPSEMTQSKKDSLKLSVGKIHTAGMTNFSGGMSKAIELGNSLDVGVDMIVRVIMFTDGAANQGIATSDAAILSLAKENRGRVSISAFGYGEDCKQELLASLSTESSGNYAFIKNPEDAMAAFAKELGGLASVHATDISVSIKATGDHKIVDVISDVDTDDIDGGVTLKVPELLAEEKRHLVIEMDLSKQKQTFPRAATVVEMEVTYSMVENGKLSQRSEKLKGKVEFVKDGSQSKKADELLDQIVGMAELVKAQLAAEEYAAAGNFQAAMSTVAVASASAGDRGLSAINSLGNNLAHTYKSAGHYATSSGYRNTASRMMSRSYGSSSSDVVASTEVASVLRSAGLSVENSTQTAAAASFTHVPDGNVLASVAGSISAPSAVLDPNPAPASDPVAKAGKKSKSSRW